MKIAKVLFTSKTLKDGTHPVMIRLQEPRLLPKYKATGVSTKYWSKTKAEVGAKDPKADEKNKIINKMYLKFQNRKAMIEEMGMEVTAELLMSDQPIKQTPQGDRRNFLYLMEEKANSCQAPRTKNEYITFKKALTSIYGDFIDVEEINQQWANHFRMKIDDHWGSHNSQKNHCIKCVYGTYTFASDNGYITNARRLKIEDFPHIKADNYITYEEVTAIINLYKKFVVGNFNPDMTDDQKMALSIFCFLIAMQGVSQIDLSGVKVGDLVVKRIAKKQRHIERYRNNPLYREIFDKEQEYRDIVVAKLNRRKSKVPVEIVMDKETIEPFLIMFGFYTKGKDEYLIPCFSKKTEGDKKKEIQRCGNFYQNLTSVLNDFLSETEKMDDSPKFQRITYSMSRKAFINTLYDLGVDPNLVRKFIGHGGKTMEKYYVTPPDEWEQSDMTRLIFNQEITIKRMMEISIKEEEK